MPQTDKRRLMKNSLALLAPAVMAKSLFAQASTASTNIEKVVSLLAAEIAQLKRLRPGYAAQQAIPKGYVGEIKTSRLASNPSAFPNDEWVDVPGLQLELEPGVWLIASTGSLYNYDTINSGSAGIAGSIRLLAGSKELAASYDACSYIIGGAFGVARENRQQDSAYSLVAVEHSSAKSTAKVQIRLSRVGAANKPVLGLRDGSTIYAVRIA